MNQKELKHLKRAELLEMLIQLKKENDALSLQLEDTQRQLKDRKIQLAQAGSMAEAALKLNGVFEAADNAAAQYLESLQYATSNQKKYCDSMIAETQKKCQKMLDDTESKCQKEIQLTQKKCTAIINKMKELCKAHPDLAYTAIRSLRSEKNVKK